MKRIYSTVLFLIFSIVLSGYVSAQETAGSNHAVPISPLRNRLSQQREEAIRDHILYHESIYLVSNYSGLYSNRPETLTIPELLQRDVEGFYFYLTQEREGKGLLLRNPDGDFAPFAETLQILKNTLDTDSLRIITLFLDFYADVAGGETVFEEAGLMDYILEYNSRSGWPSLGDMVRTGKRLVVFEMQKHVFGPEWLHNLEDFAAGFSEIYRTSAPTSTSFEDKLSKSLYIFTGYKNQQFYNASEDDFYAFARQTPYLIEIFKNAWIREGQIPNFIFLDSNFYWLNGILFTLRSFNLVYGTVTYNNELINYVNWQGLNNYTTGKFCFPLEQGALLTLSPLVPGYRVTPRCLSVTGSGRRVFLEDFKARPVAIEENLEVYIPVDQQVKDLTGVHPLQVSDVDIIYEQTRGKVASFGDRSRIGLPTAEILRMKDHDFTMSVWVNIPKYIADKRDYSVLGTKGNAYQRGLHFLIRNNKPYMGFFNNDLEGNTEIEPGKWYHIVWRYNKANGEQAIFVNGKLDALASFRPAYLGSDSLYIGYANLSEGTNFVGLMDNIAIWSRVLSDKEILGIHNQLFDISVSSSFSKKIRELPGLLIVVIIGLLILPAGVGGYFYYRKKKVRRETVPISRKEELFYPVSQAPDKVTNGVTDRNYIRLFGDFSVSDAKGNNITALFTPKLKQLFLVLLVYSQEDRSGISSSELSRMVWGDDSLKSTKSLRSVSILKLRKILEGLDKVEILFQGNKYSIVISGNVYCDYLICMKVFREKKIRSREDFEQLYTIISRGEVFKGESFDWLDDSKAYICNHIVDVLLKFINEYSQTDNPDKVIFIADQILLNDPVNEEALFYKIKTKAKQNNINSAKYTYEKFCVVYTEMYGEPFPKSFEEILS